MNVSTVHQSLPYWCGPSAGEAVLRYFGLSSVPFNFSGSALPSIEYQRILSINMNTNIDVGTDPYNWINAVGLATIIQNFLRKERMDFSEKTYFIKCKRYYLTINPINISIFYKIKSTLFFFNKVLHLHLQFTMDKTKHHFTFKERVMLKDLLELDSLKRKNGKPNISKIAKILHKNRNTIRREIKRLKDNEYDAKLAHEDYLQKRQKCFKKSSLLLNILEWLDEKYNKFHDSPEQICKKYEKEFGIKFPVWFKTLYKYIHLGFLNFKKDNLYFHGRKYKTKNRIDNRGKIRNFRTIEEAKHDKYEFGWFQMDTMVGKNNSVCLVLIEELTQFKIIEPLKEKTTKEVTNAVERFFSNRFFKDRCKGIITDQGKEFVDWEKIEKITNSKVYFCDAGTPTQKPKVERVIRDFRHWFSKGIDLSIYSRNYYQEVANIINSKLKKSLHWLSSKEVFLQMFNF